MLISRSIGRSLRMRQYRLAYSELGGNVTLYSSTDSGIRPRSVRAVKTTYSPSNFWSNASISVVGSDLTSSITIRSEVVFVALKYINLHWLNIRLSAHKKTPDFGSFPKSGAKLLQKKSIIGDRWRPFLTTAVANFQSSLEFGINVYQKYLQVYSKVYEILNHVHQKGRLENW